MRTLALVLALASLGGCRRAPDCTATCEARDKVIKCGNTNCKELCTKLHTSPVCGAEFKTFEGCLLKQPVDKWECDDGREPALKPGVCMNERGAVMKCLQSAPVPTVPPTPPPAAPAKP